MNPALLHAVKTRTVANAYCIEGASAAVVRAEAGEFLSALFCAKGTTCGECPACKKLAAGFHPDVCFIEMPIVDKNHKAPPSKVEVFKSLLYGFSYVSAFEGGFKAVVIPEAEELSVEMQNALLKVLEEPPAKTVFLLGTRTAKRLLPTILSRCIILKAGANNGAGNIKPADLGVTADQLAVLYRVAAGDGRLAAEYGAEYFEIREDMRALLRLLWQADMLNLGEMESLLLKYVENIARAVGIAQVYIADVINYKYTKNPDNIINTDLLPDIKIHAELPNVKLSSAARSLLNFAAKRERCPGWDVSMSVTDVLLEILEA